MMGRRDSALLMDALSPPAAESKAPLALHIDDATSHQWEKWLLTAERTAYQQHWAYGEMLAQCGTAVHRLRIEQDGRTVALVQLQRRRIARLLQLTLALRGPVWLESIDNETKVQAYQLLRSALPHLRWPHLSVWMPDAADTATLKATGRVRAVSGYATVLLPLDGNEDDWLARMDGKWRNRLRAAQKSELTIERLTSPESYLWLLHEEMAQAKRKRYAALHPMMVPLWQERAGASSVLALAAHGPQGECVAAVLLLVHGRTATYHIGWSNEQGRHLSAHNLLLFDAMRKLKSIQVRTLDLGGIATHGDGGLARFKLGTSGGDYTLLDGGFI